jgi:hypothetical protein
MSRVACGFLGRRALFLGLVNFAVFSGQPSITSAAAPQVHFDASTVVECRDVTPHGFAEVYPNERIVEAIVRISTLVVSGREEDFEDLLLVMDSPEKRLRVADFAPKTELVSDVVGTIDAKATNEKTKTTDFKLGGVLSASYGLASVQVLPSTSTTNTRHDSVTEEYKRLPNRSLALASGTIHGEHGVFFKLKRTPLSSLEGSKDFTCLFVVPKNWRGDWLVVTCQARGFNKVLLTKSLEECGRAQILVGLYAAGDAVAKDHVERVIARKDEGGRMKEE